MAVDSPVEVEILKAEDVENSDALANMPRISVDLVDSQVDLVNQPDKHASIDAFHHSITHIHRCLGVERL